MALVLGKLNRGLRRHLIREYPTYLLRALGAGAPAVDPTGLISLVHRKFHHRRTRARLSLFDRQNTFVSGLLDTKLNPSLSVFLSIRKSDTVVF